MKYIHTCITRQTFKRRLFHFLNYIVIYLINKRENKYKHIFMNFPWGYIPDKCRTEKCTKIYYYSIHYTYRYYTYRYIIDFYYRFFNILFA